MKKENELPHRKQRGIRTRIAGSHATILRGIDPEEIKKLWDYIKSLNILGNILLFGAIITANVTVYISYFDVNSLSVIDSTTAIKHTLGFTMLYAMAYAGVAIFLQFLQSYILTKDSLDLVVFHLKIPLKIREELHSIIENFFCRFTITILIFSIIYVGLEKSAIIMLLFLIYFGFIIFSKYSHSMEIIKGTAVSSDASKNTTDFQGQLTKEKLINVRLLENVTQYLEFITDIFKESKENLKNGKYFEFVIGKVGVFFLLLSISFGVARAVYVEDNVHVKINKESVIYAIYMTTSSGVGLYDLENRIAIFSSWDSIDKMKFIKNKRRTLENILDNK